MIRPCHLPRWALLGTHRSPSGIPHRQQSGSCNRILNRTRRKIYCIVLYTSSKSASAWTFPVRHLIIKMMDPSDTTQADLRPRNEAIAHPLQHYKDPATAMLTIATFAATITFTITLAPRQGGETATGLNLLAFANSLFCGAIIGCILIIIGIELSVWSRTEQARVKAMNQMRNSGQRSWLGCAWMRSFDTFEDSMLWIVQITAGFVGTMFYVAFFLLLYATRLFLQYDGPFILGSIFYLLFGLIALISWIWSFLLEYLANKIEKQPARVEHTDALVTESSVNKRA